MNSQMCNLQRPIALEQPSELDIEGEVIVQRPRDRESRFKPFDLGVSAQWLQGRRGQSAAHLGLSAA